MGKIGTAHLFGTSWANVISLSQWGQIGVNPAIPQTPNHSVYISEAASTQEYAIPAMNGSGGTSILGRPSPMKLSSSDEDEGGTTSLPEDNASSVDEFILDIAKRFGRETGNRVAHYIEQSEDSSFTIHVMREIIAIEEEKGMSPDEMASFLIEFCGLETDPETLPEISIEDEKRIAAASTEARQALLTDREFDMLRKASGSFLIKSLGKILPEEVLAESSIETHDLAIRAFDEAAPEEMRGSAQDALFYRVFPKRRSLVDSLHPHISNALSPVLTITRDMYYDMPRCIVTQLIDIITSEDWRSPKSFAARMALVWQLRNSAIMPLFRAETRHVRKLVAAYVSEDAQKDDFEFMYRAADTYKFFSHSFDDNSEVLVEEIESLLRMLENTDLARLEFLQSVLYHMLTRALRSGIVGVDEMVGKLLEIRQRRSNEETEEGIQTAGYLAGLTILIDESIYRIFENEHGDDPSGSSEPSN